MKNTYFRLVLTLTFLILGERSVARQIDPKASDIEIAKEVVRDFLDGTAEEFLRVTNRKSQLESFQKMAPLLQVFRSQFATFDPNSVVITALPHSTKCLSWCFSNYLVIAYGKNGPVDDQAILRHWDQYSVPLMFIVEINRDEKDLRRSFLGNNRNREVESVTLVRDDLGHSFLSIDTEPLPAKEKILLGSAYGGKLVDNGYVLERNKLAELRDGK